MNTGHYKGLRYWLLWFLGITVPVMLLIIVYASMLSGMTAGKVFLGLLLLYLFLAFVRAVQGTSPRRFPVFENDPEHLGFQYEDVNFSSRDGLALSGWYVPSSNRAAIVICHGFGGNRLMVSPVARLLVKHGFGVLLFDFRAHGRSAGDLSAWGWRETEDLLGALDVLKQRPEVDPARIGVLGYSLGGQVALRASPQSELIRAVAVEGPSPAVFADHLLTRKRSLKKIIFLPYLWLVYTCHRLLVGRPAPAGVLASMPLIAPRPLLLIASGDAGEKLFMQHLFDRAASPKELFAIPEAHHVEGLLARPEEYEHKLVDFFSRALGVNQQPAE